MDTLLSIAAVLLFVFLTDALDNKKKKVKLPPGEKTGHPDTAREVKLPPPVPEPWPGQTGSRPSTAGTGQRKIGFEIPEIKGAPTNGKYEQEQERVCQERETQLREQAEHDRQEQKAKEKVLAYEVQKHLLEAAERAEEERVYRDQSGLPGAQRPKKQADLRPQTILDAVAFAEILGRPKAYAHRNPYFRH